MRSLFEGRELVGAGLALRVRLRPETRIDEDPTGAMQVAHPWGELRMEGVAAPVRSTVRRLASGWLDQQELRSMVVGSDSRSVGEIVTLLAQHLSALERLGFLVMLQLVSHERPLLTVEPLSYASTFTLPAHHESHARLSRFAFLTPHPDGLAMESAVSTHRIVLHDEWGAILVSRLASERVAGKAQKRADEGTEVAIDLLRGAGMLQGGEEPSAAGIGTDLLEMGEFHDLLFHRRSRFGRHDGAFGAEFPYIEKIPPRSAIARGLDVQTVPLPVPEAGAVRATDLTLTEALETRASHRHYGPRPLSLAQLGEFLFRVARVRGQYGPSPAAGMPYQASDRPYPSGGGIHDLELYLIVSGVEGLPVGAYHHAADRHALERLAPDAEATAALLRAAMRASAAPAPPQVLFKIASRFSRMTWKYRAISYATTLKNVGVLYQTMYLVATAMGLGGCALGSGDDVAAEGALGLASRSEIAVGEFMLGTRAAVAPGREGDPTWVPLIEPRWGRG